MNRSLTPISHESEPDVINLATIGAFAWWLILIGIVLLIFNPPSHGLTSSPSSEKAGTQMSQPDAYDNLIDAALLDGQRIAPLFLVFFNPDSVTEMWRVCPTNIMGDAQGPNHSTHATLKDAFEECRRMNFEAGPAALRREILVQPLTFTEKIIAAVDAELRRNA